MAQGQRVPGSFIIITGQNGIRYALRPNQIVVIHDADECHDETILRIYGGHIVRVPCSLEEVTGWLGPWQPSEPCDPQLLPIANGSQVRDIRGMEPSFEQMARSLVESGDYRVTSRLEALAEYHPPNDTPKLIAAVVDVETTGSNPDHDKIIELGVCLFEYDRQNGRIYKVLGSWQWFEDPGVSIPPAVTQITGITDEMVAGHRIDERAVDDLLDRVVLVIAHHADFDRRFLEERLPAFAPKHWGCSRFDIDWKADGIRSSALEFVAYSLGFFHDGHRAASDCRATLNALAQRLPGTGRLALQALLEQARLPSWRIWPRDATIEKKDALKARGYSWSPGEFGRPKCWYRDVSDADKAAEVSWLRANVMGPDQAVWGLRITARDRYSDRCWSWGERLGMRGR